MSENISSKNKIRCHFCNKKQLFLHKCSCNYSFCLTHRFPDTHNCTCKYTRKDQIIKPCIAKKVIKI